MKYGWLVPLALTSFLTACMTAGPGRSSSSGVASTKGIKELYVGPGVTQYFLLPQRLQGPAGRSAELDMVVRDSAGVLRYCLLHISVIEPSGATFGPVDTLLLQTGNRLTAVAPPHILYAERQRAGQLTRLELPLSAAQTMAYLRAPSSYALAIGRPGAGRLVYQPGKRAVKCLNNFSAAAIH
jgi:hypothetical protein